MRGVHIVMIRDRMSRPRALAVAALTAVAVMAPAAPRASPDWLVISFPGNTLEWNGMLGVSELRVPCTNPPADCMKRLKSLSRDEGVKRFTISMTRDQAHVASFAAAYSEISRSEPALRGIGIDDFVSTLRHWQSANDDRHAPTRTLQEALTKAKSANPSLEFGITLYEDQLQSPLLGEPNLSAGLRLQIDRVSLFIHYRENGPGYRDYVRQVRALFPKADIIAGVYAYDRIDYLPCAKGGSRSCTSTQEADLFGQAFSVQVDMLKHMEIDGIEFFPGRFGVEQDWPTWTKNPRTCRPARLQECLEMTRQMRARALAILEKARSDPD
jgi:hypothetical protein